jgi:flagellar hook-basal body complex protein FliE
MGIGAIDSGRIQAMLSQLKAAAENHPTAATNGPTGLKGLDKLGPQESTKSDSLDFASALKSSLDQVNQAQSKATAMGKSFALGDDSVNLSDVMVATQKASITFQATVQVRNKLVSAYHDIMNMQI